MSDLGPTLYTIGHSNQAIDPFLDLLRANGIEILVDTRSRPNSKWVPHFNADMLKGVVEAAGVRFVFLGDALGGRPEGAQFYDAEGRVLYDKVAEHPDFVAGVAKVERAACKNRIALLCSEENPAGCHRRLLVGRVLAQRGLQIVHIRSDGRLQTEAELQAEEQAECDGQQALFEVEEVTPWKSIRSVSRKRPPSSSSRR